MKAIKVFVKYREVEGDFDISTRCLCKIGDTQSLLDSDGDDDAVEIKSSSVFIPDSGVNRRRVYPVLRIQWRDFDVAYPTLVGFADSIEEARTLFETISNQNPDKHYRMDYEAVKYATT